MNYKKLSGILMALCIVAVPFQQYNVTVNPSVCVAVDTIDVGTINLDNEHPSATATLSNVNVRDWYTSDSSVAVVDSQGTITAVGKGSCIISAECEEAVYQVYVISDYEPAEQGITEIEMENIMLSNSASSKQIAFDAPAGTVISFSSSDETIATVDENGLVTATGTGKCQIYAEIENTRYIFNVISAYTGESGTINIGSTELTPESPIQVITISGIDEGTEINWRSSDDSIAVVNSKGAVSGISKGSCTIYAETADRTFTISVNVSFNIEDIMSTITINGIGNEAYVTFAGINDNAVWTSDNESIAVADGSGKIKAVNYGETIIKVRFDGGEKWFRIEVKGNSEAEIVYGDANVDGKVNIADATSIVQYIANGDKYPLGDDGLANADVDGLKGITGNDALVLQQFEAGIVSMLPLTQMS